MRRHPSQRWMAIGLPIAAGLAILGLGLALMPGPREVEQAARRAAPPAPSAVPPAAPVIAAAPSVPAPPELAPAIRSADAAELVRLTQALIDRGVAVTTAQVAYDLAAAGRPAVALAYLAARPDGAMPATWPLRIALLRESGRDKEAVALLTAAAARPSDVPAAAIMAAGYALDRPDLIITAAASGTIPPPDAKLAHDLAQRAEARGRLDWIAWLDRAGGADWRAGDPWLALRVAIRSGDSAAALRAIGGLPAGEQDAARTAWMTRTGDRAGLRGQILAQAAQPGADLPVLAERLLALDARADAIALLRRAAADQSPGSAVGQRLLYLMGPRPAPADRDWLRARALAGDVGDQTRWLAAYAERDAPATALAFVQRHPLAARTDVAILRLQLAQAAGDRAAARQAMATLLDGRSLEPVTLRRVSGLADGLDPAQARSLAERRIAAGIAGPRDRLDLAWAAWNAGDAAATRDRLRDYLAEVPGDLPALRLMADAQARLGGPAAAGPWLERALLQAPRTGRTRVELLDRLGRRDEALALVTAMRRDAPRDMELAALHARLLIAAGQPGRARAVLRP